MVHTHDISFRALLDTGASCRILRRNIFEQLIGQTHQICHLLKTRRMQAVNGTEIHGLGSCEFRFSETNWSESQRLLVVAMFLAISSVCKRASRRVP